MTLRRIGVAAAWLLLCALVVPDLSAQTGPLRPGVKRAQSKRKDRSGKRTRQGVLPQRRDPIGGGQRDARQARVGDANGQLLRLMQMTPESRQEFFETNERFGRLPAARREAIRKRLDELDRLPAEERELLVNRYQLFNRLPRERQVEARQIFEDWRQLPRERRNQVVTAVRRLRAFRAERRELALKSERFVGAYDDSERSIIKRLLALTPDSPAGVRD